MTIVTPPVPANSLLALVGADTPVGYRTFGGIMRPDHANDAAYFIEYALVGTGDPGMKKLTCGTSGAETLQATEIDIFGDDGMGSPLHTLGSGGSCYHPSGPIFTGVDGLSN